MSNYSLYGGTLIGTAHIYSQNSPVAEESIPSLTAKIEPVFVGGQIFLGSWAISDMAANILMAISIMAVIISSSMELRDWLDRRTMRRKAKMLDPSKIEGWEEGDPLYAKLGEVWFNYNTNTTRVVVRGDDQNFKIIPLGEPQHGETQTMVNAGEGST